MPLITAVITVELRKKVHVLNPYKKDLFNVLAEIKIEEIVTSQLLKVTKFIRTRLYAIDSVVNVECDWRLEKGRKWRSQIKK